MTARKQNQAEERDKKELLPLLQFKAQATADFEAKHLKETLVSDKLEEEQAEEANHCCSAVHALGVVYESVGGGRHLWLLGWDADACWGLDLQAKKNQRLIDGSQDA